MIGILFLERTIIQNAHESLKPTELPEYQRWANSPLELKPEDLQLKPELPDALTNERAAVFIEARRQYETWSSVLGKGKPSTLEQVQNSRPLTDGQLEDLTSVTSTFAPLFARAKALFSNPDYVSNQRTYPPGKVTQFMDFNMTLRALDVYTRRNIYNGDIPAALDALDVMLAMNGHDPYSGYIYTVSAVDAGSRAARIARVIESSTSDTAHLQILLDTLNRHRDQLYGTGEAVEDLGDYFRVFRQAMADGYTTESTITPRTLHSYGITLEEDYLLWLEPRLPANSPRRAGVQRRLAEYRSVPRGKFNIGGALSRSPLKFVIKRLERASVEVFLVNQWKHERNTQKTWASSRLNYDTARISLARRIAKLNGDPVPETLEDFVPKYLAAYPVDASTGSPVRVPSTDPTTPSDDATTTALISNPDEPQP